MKYFVFAALIGLGLVSCNNDEGLGGDSTIRGKIVQHSLDEDFKVVQGVAPIGKEDVYIIYGNNASYGDKVETNYDGTFEFNYLQKGSYKIFYYSEDSVSKSKEKVAVVKEVSVGKGGTFDTGNLIKYKTLQIEDGSGTIRGRVILTNYKNNWAEIKDVGPAQEQEVYLVYNGHKSDDIRVRTNYDGVYEFKNLIKGSYLIYAYSEDKSGGTEKLVKSSFAVVSSDNEVVVLDDFNVDKQ